MKFQLIYLQRVYTETIYYAKFQVYLSKPFINRSPQHYYFIDHFMLYIHFAYILEKIVLKLVLVSVRLFTLLYLLIVYHTLCNYLPVFQSLKFML